MEDMERKVDACDSNQGTGKYILARKVLYQQLDMGWPGLAQEAQEICMSLGLPNICAEDVGKDEVKDAIIHHHLMELKMEIKEKNYRLSVI